VKLEILILLICLAFVFLLSCAGPEPHAPIEAYRAWYGFSPTGD
jgi:hypothetical protein